MVRAWELQGSAHLILVAADNGGLRDALAFMLKIEGYVVSVVSNAQAALALNHSDLPACVIIDDAPLTPALPVAAELRQGGGRFPIIILARSGSHLMRAGAADLDATVVEKPLTPALFLSAVEAAFAG